jgi:hypothetical protein
MTPNIYQSKWSIKMKEWLSKQPFSVLKWHVQSSNLNPIEHLWATLKQKLNHYPTPPKGLIELWEHVFETFHSITSIECKKLYESMPQRMRVVLYTKDPFLSAYIIDSQRSKTESMKDSFFKFEYFTIWCVLCSQFICEWRFYYSDLKKWVYVTDCIGKLTMLWAWMIKVENFEHKSCRTWNNTQTQEKWK